MQCNACNKDCTSAEEHKVTSAIVAAMTKAGFVPGRIGSYNSTTINDKELGLLKSDSWKNSVNSFQTSELVFCTECFKELVNFEQELIIKRQEKNLVTNIGWMFAIGVGILIYHIGDTSAWAALIGALIVFLMIIFISKNYCELKKHKPTGGELVVEIGFRLIASILLFFVAFLAEGLSGGVFTGDFLERYSNVLFERQGHLSDIVLSFALNLLSFVLLFLLLLVPVYWGIKILFEGILVIVFLVTRKK